MLGQLELAGAVAALTDLVTVAPGALEAETAGETYQAQNPQELAHVLGGVLYQTLHTGRAKPLESAQRTWRDPAFDALLDEATGARRTPLDVQAAPVAAGGVHALVDGLRVHVPDEHVLGREDGTARIQLPSARPGLSPGFFYVTSGRGRGPGGGATLRLYARLDTPDAAPGVWGALVAFLEDSGVPWRAKISSSRVLYPRNDAVVVYLPRPGWRIARACADLLQGTGLLGGGTSPFTQPITESVGCAFEPDDQRPARREQSFGQHRTQVFADALIRHALLPDGEQEPVEQVVAAAFIDANIDPAVPARNLSSPVADVLRGY
ncbi:T3SS effector HopA1 family protein [Kitasatospora sp. NPDC089509]|uniref:T3SS effector HopA1 family protein n=1 Tax=Kitasatospora sp. NPDC089509 TaxID=3364079 RepID=UPI0037FC4B0E